MAKTSNDGPQEIYDLPDFPSRRTIPYLIQYLARLMTADYLEFAAKSEVAPAQSYVLRELWRQEPLSQVQISQRLDIGKATVGQSLKRLERDGFVRRRQSPEDGRVTLVYLTEKGRSVRGFLAKASRKQVADIHAVLGPTNASQLEILLEKLLTYQRDR